MIQHFKIIEHTSDIGITVYGKTLEELFENSAYGMFSQITDLKKVEPQENTEIEVREYDKENLLVNWLNELLYLSVTGKIIFSKFKIKRFQETCDSLKLNAEVKGERINSKKHSLHLEIKAATYHNLKIEKTKKGYQTTIIFDV